MSAIDGFEPIKNQADIRSLISTTEEIEIRLRILEAYIKSQRGYDYDAVSNAKYVADKFLEQTINTK